MAPADDLDDLLAALQGQFAARLTPWETDFVASLAEQWEEQKSLSDKQRAKLNEVFERAATRR
jgi:hypothetical protein